MGEGGWMGKVHGYSGKILVNIKRSFHEHSIAVQPENKGEKEIKGSCRAASQSSLQLHRKLLIKASLCPFSSLQNSSSP